jgi:hypothetical protein
MLLLVEWVLGFSDVGTRLFPMAVWLWPYNALAMEPYHSDNEESEFGETIKLFDTYMHQTLEVLAMTETGLAIVLKIAVG